MCRKTDFDAKTAEFDRRLLELFEQRRSFVGQRNDETTLKYTSWLEEFCSYVWDSLVCFEELRRLKEPLRPQKAMMLFQSNRLLIRFISRVCGLPWTAFKGNGRIARCPGRGGGPQGPARAVVKGL